MKIGIIGPNILYNASDGGLEHRKDLLAQVAEIVSMSGQEIVLTPDKGSLLEFFGNKYLELNGKKIWIIAPMKDDAEKYLNLSLGEVIDCETWFRQPSKFSEETDLFVCLGYSGGVLSELGASKYFSPKKIVILNEFVSYKLPEEINQGLSLYYCSIYELRSLLNTSSS